MLTNYDKPLSALCNLANETCIHVMNNIIGKDIRADTRDRDVVKGRQIVMWYLNTQKEYTLQKTANVFKMDHATVIHAKKAVGNIKDTKDKMYYPILKKFLRQIN